MPAKIKGMGILRQTKHDICDEATKVGLISYIIKNFKVTIIIGRINTKISLKLGRKAIIFRKINDNFFQMIFIHSNSNQLFNIESKTSGLIEKVISSVKERFTDYSVEYDSSIVIDLNIPDDSSSNIVPSINTDVVNQLFTIIADSDLDQGKIELFSVLFSKLYLKEFDPEVLQKEITSILQEICNATKSDEIPDHSCKEDRIIIDNLIRLMEYTSKNDEEDPAKNDIKKFLSKITQTVTSLDSSTDILEPCNEFIYEVLGSQDILLEMTNRIIKQKKDLYEAKKIDILMLEKSLSETGDAIFKTVNRMQEIKKEISPIELENIVKFKSIEDLAASGKLDGIKAISENIGRNMEKINTLNIEFNELDNKLQEYTSAEDGFKEKRTKIAEEMEKLNCEINILNSTIAIIENRFEMPILESSFEDDEQFFEPSTPDKLTEEIETPSDQKDKIKVILDRFDSISMYGVFRSNMQTLIKKFEEAYIKLSEIIKKVLEGQDALDDFLERKGVFHLNKKGKKVIKETPYSVKIFERLRELGIIRQDNSLDIEKTNEFLSKKNLPRKNRRNKDKIIQCKNTQELRNTLSPLCEIDVEEELKGEGKNLGFEKEDLYIILGYNLIDLLVKRSNSIIVKFFKDKIGEEKAIKLLEYLNNLQIVNSNKSVNITKMNNFLQSFK